MMIIAPHVLMTFLSPLSRLTQLVLTTTLAAKCSYLPDLTQRKLGTEKLNNSLKVRGRPGVGQVIKL